MKGRGLCAIECSMSGILYNVGMFEVLWRADTFWGSSSLSSGLVLDMFGAA